jgi:hypothetical protein
VKDRLVLFKFVSYSWLLRSVLSRSGWTTYFMLLSTEWAWVWNWFSNPYAMMDSFVDLIVLTMLYSRVPHLQHWWDIHDVCLLLLRVSSKWIYLTSSSCLSLWCSNRERNMELWYAVYTHRLQVMQTKKELFYAYWLASVHLYMCQFLLLSLSFASYISPYIFID